MNENNVTCIRTTVGTLKVNRDGFVELETGGVRYMMSGAQAEKLGKLIQSAGVLCATIWLNGEQS